ncbi:NUDIX hydrolase [Haliovirga abyssi]|uniref:NUDIX hydrolase n=1 Tax=Haliovirga abyssi TaxID=2996794 RepID=A0AAU9DKJ1_9FUSO|nr:NUDIX domain-containing protein [Haliovirga abyssi]BDU50412.1 NUDIX hydrolase [Haliovirga abyssi]
MEIWDIYDKERCITGNTIKRGSEFNDNEFHLVVHICIFNSKGQMLIQRRQPFKKGWPNMWDITVGGSSIAGESSSQAAERELFEEIGYKADFSKRRPFFTINFSYGFDDYYIIEDDVDIDTLKLQYEEVQCVRWATKDEIIDLIDKGEFISYYKNLIRLMFDMRKQRGAIIIEK